MKKSIRLLLGNVVMWLGVFLFGCIVTAYGKTNPISDYSRSEEKEAFSIQEENYEKENLNSDNNQKKVAYLTFDDGPSNHSEQLLDLLEEEGVKATFFVVAKDDVESERIYQRIVRDGHGLGLHSYSHIYEKIYSSPELFQEDLWKLKTFLYHKTGVSCNIYRFPGGSSNSMMKFPIEDCKEFLEEKNIRYFDWNSSAEDAVCVGSSPDVLLKRVLKDALKYNHPVILMHDLNCCETTLNMVRPLIRRLKQEGYAFDRLTCDTNL